MDNPANSPSQQNQKSTVNTVVLCLGLTFGMLGVSFAAVPLYAWFCQVTGYAGTTQRADSAGDTILSKKINIRFDSNVSNDLDWQFAPKVRQVSIKIGEKSQMSYFAKNVGMTESFGTATFNVSPGTAGAYFNKIECFCFTEQLLKPGQQVDMPVVFFVDPEIVNDPLLKDTKTITLSYTFFPDETATNKTASNVEETTKNLITKTGSAGENVKSRL